MVNRNIDGDVHQDLARLLVGTGLRWSEFTALQVQDVDLLNRKLLHVRRAWKRRDGLFLLGSPKTDRSRRTVTLSAEFVEMLVPLVAARNPAEFLLTTPARRPKRHSNFYNRVWLPAVARARRCDTRAAEPEPCGCRGTLTKQPRIHDCATPTRRNSSRRSRCPRSSAGSGTSRSKPPSTATAT
jgi:integrase